MGEVYRATDSVLERTVAVKLLSDHYASQDDARARFRREALAAARLSSAPNVVNVFDVAEHQGRPLIVMEFLEGGSVFERMRHGRIPRATALAWLGQAAVAIDRAHSREPTPMVKRKWNASGCASQRPQLLVADSTCERREPRRCSSRCLIGTSSCAQEQHTLRLGSTSCRSEFSW